MSVRVVVTIGVLEYIDRQNQDTQHRWDVGWIDYTIRMKFDSGISVQSLSLVVSSPESGNRLTPSGLDRIGYNVDIALTSIRCKVETHDQDEVPDGSAFARPYANHSLREDEGTSSVVVAPCFDVGIGQKEDRENDGDNVPLWEDQARQISSFSGPRYIAINILESINLFAHTFGIPKSAESDHEWNLQQADLESVRRADLHTTSSATPFLPPRL